MDVPGKRAIAREYDVSEGAIKKVWDKREQILERSTLMFDEVKEKTFRSFVGRFTELIEDMFYIWIESMCVPIFLFRHLSPSPKEKALHRVYRLWKRTSRHLGNG
jgi:hypothetical protein